MYLRKCFALIVTAGLMGSSGALVSADDAPTPQAVLSDLHHSNQMEIEMGKLAKKNGNSDAIKEFGETLVNDHTDADKKVMDVAKSQNIKLTDEKMPMGDENQTMSRLTSLQGKEFDRAFAQAMVDDHRKDIDKLQAAQKSLSGTPTGNLASTVLPVVQKHERIASDLVATLK